MSQALTPKGELAVRAAAPRESGPGELTVALYPYVPDPQLFQDKVSQAWAALGTGYALSFQTYDPYSGPPAPTIDVFAFDCSFSGSLVGEYAVSPLRPDEVDSPEDLYRFARDAATGPDGHFVGIPYLGCCSTLYYRDGDQPLGKPELSLDALFAVLGAAPYPEKEIPAPGQGLIVELRGSTTDACMYQQAWEQLNGGAYPSPRSRQPTGSTPGRSTRCASLSRWRAWPRRPSGTPARSASSGSRRGSDGRWWASRSGCPP
jgi:hypothetical protein